MLCVQVTDGEKAAGSAETGKEEGEKKEEKEAVEKEKVRVLCAVHSDVCTDLCCTVHSQLVA